MSTITGSIGSTQESTSGFLVVDGGLPIILLAGGWVVGTSSVTFGCGYVTGSGPSSPPSPLLVAPELFYFYFCLEKESYCKSFTYYPLQTRHQIQLPACELCSHPIYQYPAM